MLDQLSATQNNVDQLAVKAATGALSSVQALTMASTEAQLMTQLTVTIRNKAVEAFKARHYLSDGDLATLKSIKLPAEMRLLKLVRLKDSHRAV